MNPPSPEQIIALAVTAADLRINLDQRETVIEQQAAVIRQQADRIAELEAQLRPADDLLTRPDVTLVQDA